MLRYAKGPSPAVLTGWQATPNADWESLSAADKDKVRAALLRDQGHLCAYCQRRIPTRDGHMKVEHWLAQSGGKDKLRWGNLVGVCLGDEKAETGSSTGEQHCDKSRGDTALFLHPVEGHGPSPREHLRYGHEGEVRAIDTTQKAVVEKDVITLNLNAARLKRARREVIEVLRQRLVKADFSLRALQDELRAAELQPGMQAIPQCEVVRYYVWRWARKKGLRL